MGFRREMVGIDISGIEPSPLHKALGEIHDHVWSTEAGPNRFQAFADYADIEQFKTVTKQPEPNPYSLYNRQKQQGGTTIEQLQYAALLETHRQRMNGLPGFETYNWEYRGVERLGKKLEAAITNAKKAGKVTDDFPTQLQSLKTFQAQEMSVNAVNAVKRGK